MRQNVCVSAILFIRQGHVGPLNECLSTDMIDLLVDRLSLRERERQRERDRERERQRERDRERETEREYHKLFVSV